MREKLDKEARETIEMAAVPTGMGVAWIAAAAASEVLGGHYAFGVGLLTFAPATFAAAFLLRIAYDAYRGSGK